MLIWYFVLPTFRTLYFIPHALQNPQNIIKNEHMATSTTSLRCEKWFRKMFDLIWFLSHLRMFVNTHSILQCVFSSVFIIIIWIWRPNATSCKESGLKICGILSEIKYDMNIYFLTITLQYLDIGCQANFVSVMWDIFCQYFFKHRIHKCIYKEIDRWIEQHQKLGYISNHIYP